MVLVPLRRVPHVVQRLRTRASRELLERTEGHGVTWLLILAAFVFWLALSTLMGMVLGRVLRTRRREDTKPGYITDWTT